eukprot:349715-Chlamydomonas_euryale.AAC.2
MCASSAFALRAAASAAAAAATTPQQLLLPHGRMPAAWAAALLHHLGSSRIVLAQLQPQTLRLNRRGTASDAAGAGGARNEAHAVEQASGVPLGVPAYAVWGANTGVGKTLASAAIARAVRHVLKVNRTTVGEECGGDERPARRGAARGGAGGIGSSASAAGAGAQELARFKVLYGRRKVSSANWHACTYVCMHVCIHGVELA